MGERITVMLDEEVVKKLRNRQAKLLRDSTKSVSFSKVLNETLKTALK